MENSWGGGALLVRWTSDWDCNDETEFYWCIKDDAFDLQAIKAKRRYEINKGIKNFDVRIIDPKEYIDEIYEVYLESLKGYPVGTTPLTRDTICETALTGWSQEDCRFFAAFDRNTEKMCGYADVYVRNRFIPISSMHCNVNSEKKNVNFSLVYGIVEWFNPLTKKGCYLCDGARNVLHETNFQDFLIKYLGFRKAYCKLHLAYKPGIGWIVRLLFPFRKLIAKIKKLNMVSSVLKMEAWSRGLSE